MLKREKQHKSKCKCVSVPQVSFTAVQISGEDMINRFLVLDTSAIHVYCIGLVVIIFLFSIVSSLVKAKDSGRTMRIVTWVLWCSLFVIFLLLYLTLKESFWSPCSGNIEILLESGLIQPIAYFRTEIGERKTRRKYGRDTRLDYKELQGMERFHIL